MFTRKAILYFSLALALLTIALLIDDFQLAILVLPIASLFFFSNLWGLPERVVLKLSRLLTPSETFGEEEIFDFLTVENGSDKPLWNVEVHEILPDKVTPESGLNETLLSIGARERLEVGFEFPSPGRGHYRIGPMIVKAQDPLGLYMTEYTVEIDTLTVIPRPERIKSAELRPRHLGSWSGVIRSRTLGPGTEFYSMRGYVAGDDPKRINWKASAKYNELVVNETEAERVTDVMVVLDTDVTYWETSAEEFERRVIAAASIVSHLLKQGNRVGVVLHGIERGSIPAGFGKRHERRTLFLLAGAMPGKASIPTIYVVTLLARRMLPSQSQIVIISPLLDPEIVEGVATLAAAGYSLLVLSPTPSPPLKFENETEEVAYRIIMLERANILSALEKTATVVQWPTNVPLSAKLSEVKRGRARPD